MILTVQPWYEEVETEAARIPSNGKLYQYHHHQNLLLDKFQYLLFGSNRLAEEYTVNIANNATDTMNLTTSTTIDPGSDGNNSAGEDEILGYVLALTAGSCITLSQIAHKAKLQKYNSFILNFYSGWVGIIVPLILSLAIEDMVFPTGKKLFTNFLKLKI